MDKIKAGYIEGTVSIVVNCLLFVIKYYAGFVTGSIALKADAWHTLSDGLTSIAVVIGAKLISKRPDKKHPFGYGRYEQIVSFVIAFVLAIVAWEFLKMSYDKFLTHTPTDFGIIGLVVTIIGILLKEGMAQFSFRLGKKTGNSSLIADAWHHRSDSLSSVVVLIGIIFVRINAEFFWWMDAALGIITALVLFYATMTIFKDAINKILGEEPDPQLIEDIKQEIQKNFDVDFNIHHIHLHNYNMQKEMTMHIILRSNMSFNAVHGVVTEIESIIKDKFDINTTIHAEPVKHAENN